jgi:2-polyprenyl-3-methyl-5-hydroxy-6-metoxy-1,4-benzoquinol methylase
MRTEAAPVAATEPPPFRCPVCDHVLGGDVVAREATPSGEVAIQRCAGCGLHVTWPRLADSQQPYTVYEESAFDAKYGAIVRGERPHDREVNYLEEVRVLRRYVPHGRVLDVGCHAGWLLGYLQRSGAPYELEGVEPSTPLAKIARERLGIPVFNGYLQNLDADPYDAVIATDVVEHVPPEDVPRFLDAVRNLLKPGGYVVLKTPNVRFTSLKSRIVKRLPPPLRRRLILAEDVWDAKEHLTLWDARTLTQVLDRHGLATVRTLVPLPVQTGRSPVGAVVLRAGLYRLARLLARSGGFPPIAQDLLVVAQRK